MILRPKTGEYFSAHGTLPVLTLRCPACRHIGTFHPIKGASDVYLSLSKIQMGDRVCPNPSCRAFVFAVMNSEGALIDSYPAERIDFDATDIPAGIVGALEEAITCHANRCYFAAAVMVRKSLEELCADRKAEGKNLEQRIRSLQGKVSLPAELFDGLHDLRLLGNDAAHFELKDFQAIGQEQTQIAIDVVKEILKRIYQTAALVSQLAKYKHPTSAQP